MDEATPDYQNNNEINEEYVYSTNEEFAAIQPGDLSSWVYDKLS